MHVDARLYAFVFDQTKCACTARTQIYMHKMQVDLKCAWCFVRHDTNLDPGLSHFSQVRFWEIQLEKMPKRLRQKTAAEETGYDCFVPGDEAGIDCSKDVCKDGHIQTKYWVFMTYGTPPDFKLPMTFLIYQKETTAKGVPHYQGYMELDTRLKFRTCMALLGFPIVKKGQKKEFPTHVARRYGTQEANIRYCSSSWYCRKCGGADAEGFPQYAKECEENCNGKKSKNKIGITVVHGKPTEVQTLMQMHEHVKKKLKTGCPKKLLYEEFPQYASQHLKWIDRQHQVYAPQRNWAPLVYWFWGESGSDKSRLAKSICTSCYFKPPDNRWFDGYDQHEVIVFNDFRKSTFTFSYLLDLIDRYPFHVEIKGAVVSMVAKAMIFTCSKPHAELWAEIAGSANENLVQLTRRITKEIKFPLSTADKVVLITDIRNKIDGMVKAERPEGDPLYGQWTPGEPVPEAVDLIPISDL